MGWIGSPEEQREFDREVDRRINIEHNQKKFGKYFICRYCKGIIVDSELQGMWEDGKWVRKWVRTEWNCRDCWSEDGINRTENSEGCENFDNGGAFENEAEADLVSKSW